MQFERNDRGVLVPAKPSISEILAKGKYFGAIKRDGKIIDEFECDNLVTDEGLNYILSAALAGGSPISSWYVGVFEGNYTPVAGNTASGIAAAATESSAYSGGVRPGWTAGSVSGKSVSNSGSRASFVFSASKTIYGAFLISSAVINGSTGTLFGAARFTSAKAVQSADELLLTYQFNASSV